LRQRKQKLQSLLSRAKSAGVLRHSEHFEASGTKMFAKACGMGLEGIVSKEAEVPYLPGRQKSWLKSKCGQRQVFIIIGYSDPRKGQGALGALYLGYHKDGGVNYAGKVGTGFSMKSAKALTERLER
jgi:bifunctional non-homologous end joining protein LigD